MIRLPRTLIGIALTLTAAAPAVASEYCVVCYSPDARYRCMTNDGRQGAGTDQRDWMQCISQIAKSGKHDSCSIDKSSTAPCLGVVSFVDTGSMDDALPGAATPAGQQPVAAGPAKDSAAGVTAQSAPAGEPQPLPPGGSGDEPGLMEKSKQSMEKAGSAIGDAAKKSWDCMSSLFKKC